MCDLQLGWGIDRTVLNVPELLTSIVFFFTSKYGENGQVNNFANPAECLNIRELSQSICQNPFANNPNQGSHYNGILQNY